VTDAAFVALAGGAFHATGLTESLIFDSEGLIGRATQSLSRAAAG